MMQITVSPYYDTVKQFVPRSPGGEDVQRIWPTWCQTRRL